VIDDDRLTGDPLIDPVRILGIGGGMSDRSRSSTALAHALRLAEEAGAQTVLADVKYLNFPIYDADWPLERYPETLPWLLDQARLADAYILCSPTFHGTITGAVKNVLDALNFLEDDEPSYFGGKVVGLMALGGGAANVNTALYHSSRALNGLCVPTVVAVPNAAVHGPTRSITDEAVLGRMGRMIEEVIDLTQRLRRSSPVPSVSR